MDFISLFGIAVGLAMDAFAVSVTQGTALRGRPLGQCSRAAVRMGICFGGFQALMPMLGWLVGKVGEALIAQIDHWVALLLLAWIGVQMIRESRQKDSEDMQADVPLKKLLTLGIATSIDALATGVVLPGSVGAGTVPLMLLSVGCIGCITLALCVVGVFVGRKFGELLGKKAELLGGCVLIVIGLKIFLEHMLAGGVQ